MAGNIKRFLESIFTKKGCANCLHHTTDRNNKIVCSLSEKEKDQCQSWDKDHSIYRHWQNIKN